jgi:hypothetical protein
MLPYWLLFLIPAFAAFSERGNFTDRRSSNFGWIGIWILLTIAIGLRYEVGGDWGQYLLTFNWKSYLPFSEVLRGEDPAYGLLNWLVAQLGFGIGLVNLVCAAVFSWGLIGFVRQQPFPWLALVIAIPYLVIVVAMGYSRQSVAIGFAMLALAGLGANSTIRFVIWIVVAALFHKTAVLLIPIAILATTRSRLWTTVWVGAIGFLLYKLLLDESVADLVEHYIEADYESQGATIRVAMNALPAAVFLIFRRYFGLEGAEQKLWTYLCIGALGFIVLLLIYPSSTAVDRMALYFIPVQIFVLSRLPLALRRRYGVGGLVPISLITYSAAVLLIWLNFASNSGYWLPYQNMLFSG